MRTDAAAMSAPIIFASDNLIISEKWDFSINCRVKEKWNF
jgi:hypothetical protein